MTGQTKHLCVVEDEALGMTFVFNLDELGSRNLEMREEEDKVKKITLNLAE